MENTKTSFYLGFFPKLLYIALICEYFYKKIPIISNIIYIANYIIFSLTFLLLIPASIFIYQIVFTNKLDNTIDTNKFTNTKKTSLLSKIWSHIETATIIIFAFLTHHWVFMIFEICLLLFAIIIKLPIIKNKASTKFAKIMLLKDL